MLPLPDSLGSAQNSKRINSARSLCSTVIYDCDFSRKLYNQIYQNDTEVCLTTYQLSKKYISAFAQVLTLIKTLVVRHMYVRLEIARIRKVKYIHKKVSGY